jgi:hypothetical protein
MRPLEWLIAEKKRGRWSIREQPASGIPAFIVSGQSRTSSPRVSCQGCL